MTLLLNNLNDPQNTRKAVTMISHGHWNVYVSISTTGKVLKTCIRNIYFYFEFHIVILPLFIYTLWFP